MTSRGRREFLWKAGLSIGAAAVGSLPVGCAASGAPVMNVEIAGSVIRFDTAIPELMVVGDAVALNSMFLEYPILLIKTSENSFTVLSTECTHLGCEVRKEPSLLRCPCHESAYDFSGSVLNGPAERPLQSYEIKMTGSIAEIRINP